MKKVKIPEFGQTVNVAKQRNTEVKGIEMRNDG